MRKILLFSLFIAIFLNSCSPKFYLRNNHSIDQLKLSFSFNPRISQHEQEKIKNEINNTVSNWNGENHYYKITISDSLSNPDLSIKVDSIFLPPRLLEISSVIIDFGLGYIAGYHLAKYHDPLYFLFLGLSLHPEDNTLIKYRLDEKISSNSSERRFQFQTNTRIFSRKQKERDRHLRNFGNQLHSFLEKMEKEYKRKNQS
jgi:hypothetical protein